ncbi:hypothetical protein XF36_11400 [Pseudonocardia sp. HH130629-09]|nr:hypothetical protein XF36_11400 [Pseudonocardia sp. HH130629-09]
MTAARAKEAATRRIGEIERDVVGLSRRIHSRPELAFEETRAAAWVAEAAQAWTGCGPAVGVGGLPTALSVVNDRSDERAPAAVLDRVRGPGQDVRVRRIRGGPAAGSGRVYSSPRLVRPPTRG